MMKKKATMILRGMAIGGLVFCLKMSGALSVWADKIGLDTTSNWGNDDQLVDCRPAGLNGTGDISR